MKWRLLQPDLVFSKGCIQKEVRDKRLKYPWCSIELDLGAVNRHVGIAWNLACLI